MMTSTMGWICFALGILSAALLAWHPLRNRKLMSKWWATSLIVVSIAAQLVNQYLQSCQQDDLKIALEKSQQATEKQNDQIKSLAGKLNEAQSLVRRLSADVKDQGLKQEAGLFMLNRTVADLTSKSTAFGTGAYGTGRYGGEPGPLERIAQAIVGLANSSREYFESRQLADIRFDPGTLAVRYLELTKNIPADYDDSSWNASEAVIFQVLVNDISSNLTRRNIYSQERLDSATSVLKAERARLLKAREHRKRL